MSPFFSGKLRSGLSPGPHFLSPQGLRQGPTGTRGIPPGEAWGLPALTVPPHHAPVPEQQGPDAHSEHAIACGGRGHQSAPARGTGRSLQLLPRTCTPLAVQHTTNTDARESQSLSDLLLEMASTVSSAYFLRLLFFVPVECPPAPSLGPPPPKLQTTLQSVPPACGRDSRLSQLLSDMGGRCCHHTSAHHGTVSRRYSVGRDCRRARGSSYSWLGGCHRQSCGRLFGSQSAGACTGQDGVYCWVQLHGGAWLPGPLL